ncbi:MAG TPA: terminase small subunit [Gemmatimonadales bacterium]|nr:terminase small subunit [Gemmatimonadales bacterium]
MSVAVQKLNARHIAFVAEFVVCLNATQAAIKAGYSTKTAAIQGSQLLRMPKIAEAIEKARSRAMIKADFDQAKVLGELGLLAFSDVDNYMVDELTGKLVAAPNAPPGVMRAVSAVKYRAVTDAEGRIERTVEFRLWDKPGSLKLAGRHVGLFPGKDQAAIEAAAETYVTKLIEKARQEKEAQRALAENREAERERAAVVDVVEAPKAPE